MRGRKFYFLHFDRQNKKKILAKIEHWKMLNSLFKKKTILTLAQLSEIKKKKKRKEKKSTHSQKGKSLLV